MSQSIPLMSSWLKSEPSDILHFLDLAKITNRKMVQNLWWGAGYNIIAIPLAAGVLAFAGLILDPAVWSGCHGNVDSYRCD